MVAEFRRGVVMRPAPALLPLKRLGGVRGRDLRRALAEETSDQSDWAIDRVSSADCRSTLGLRRAATLKSSGACGSWLGLRRAADNSLWGCASVLAGVAMEGSGVASSGCTPVSVYTGRRPWPPDIANGD